MKYTFTFLLLLVCPSVFAQEELPTYNGVVDATGWSRQELYERAQQWLKQLKYQVSVDDAESGFISVGGEIRVRQPGSRKLRKGRLIYVITMIIEDQKYWYDFAQFYYDVVPSNRKEAKQGNWLAAHPSDPQNAALYQVIETTVKQKIEDLRQTMLAGGQIATSPENLPMGNKR